jgi:catechol 2,3-dioxygenase-like lactoylglutathione lyase family enzyme
MTKNDASITAVSLTVSDMTASLAFYRRLGLVIPEESVWPANDAGHHVAVTLASGLAFELDSVAMTKSFDPGWTQPPGPSRDVLVLSMPSRGAVDDLYADMTSAGYAGHLEPFDAFWGARYAIIDDPDGNHIGIMSPMEEQRRSAPPQL